MPKAPLDHEDALAHHETAKTIASFAREVTQQQQQQTSNSLPRRTSVDILYSSIGFGIDSSPLHSNDATEAAVKAVADALERAQFRFEKLIHSFPHLYLHVKIGVPVAAPRSDVMFNHLLPMNIDTRRITALLPTDIPVLPLEVVVGGLKVVHGESASVLSVVASLSIQHHGEISTNRIVGPERPALVQHHPQTHHPPGMVGSPVTSSVSSSGAHPNVVAVPATWAEVEEHSSDYCCNSSRGEANTVSVASSTIRVNNSVNPAPPPLLLSSPVLQITNKISSNKNLSLLHRANSMELLAHVSAEMHEEEEDDEEENCEHNMINSSQTKNSSSGGCGPTGAGAEGPASASLSTYNYRKLPPGITPNKNQRIFVKHQYRDHSSELPRSDELDLLSRSAPLRTPNAAFPLKLHETLKQIELDGLDHILGWLPHGRSFKIFKQKEFVDTVLPRYFVMTKKSSFLRQLNLYGFNRLSGLGADQGSYYHEKFLRGMRFLSRRMQRQKVNGNGIRSAGDPESEPNLSLYPPCPLVRLGERAPPPPVPAPPPAPPVIKATIPRITTTAALAAVSAVAAPAVFRVPTNSFPSAAPLSNGKATVGPSNPDTIRGVQVSFPLKLQRILDKLEAEGQTDVVGWLPHGRAFLVHDPRRFVSELMPVYFNQSKFSSFQRQLHMYSFNRITASGPDKGAYHHPLCLRGQPQLAMKMKRTRVNGKGTRRPGNPNDEPDFYSTDVIPPIPRGTRIDIPMESGPNDGGVGFESHGCHTHHHNASQSLSTTEDEDDENTLSADEDEENVEVEMVDEEEDDDDEEEDYDNERNYC